MAKKKKSRKKTRQTGLGSQLKRALFGLALVAALTIAIGFWVHQLLGPKHDLPVGSAPKALKPKFAKQIPFEVFPKEEPTRIQKPAPPRPPKPPPVAPAVAPPPDVKLPRVAIIIDDIGYDAHLAGKLMEMDAPITFAVLPYSPFWYRIVNKARKKDIEIMLHLPMEPIEYPDVDPGPGALLTSMSPDELILRLNEDLDAIPFIRGVNNHMGSKLTTTSSQMYQIFTILKKRNLFFIDSRTHSKSVCKPSARLFRIPFAQRDVFLDHVQEPAAIRAKIDELVQLAKERGQAVGIGHPHESTCQALYEALPDLRKKVKLVPASTVVAIPE